MNQQLTKKDTIKVLSIAGISVVVLLGGLLALQRMQANSYHTESLRAQAIEMGHGADTEGGGPIEEEGQRSNPNFVP